MPEQHASGRPAEWAVLRTAEQLSAEIWRDTLREAGIPAQLAPGDTMSFLGVTSAPVRLVVPAELVEAAERVLGELEAAGRAAESDGG
jgi:hypothetical protein